MIKSAALYHRRLVLRRHIRTVLYTVSGGLAGYGLAKVAGYYLPLFV